MALAKLFLPVNGAQNAIKRYQSWQGLLIRPCITAAIQVNLLKREVISHSAESVHHAAIDVTIVLVFVTQDELEVSADEPGLVAGSPELLKLMEELNLGCIILRPVDHRDPPRRRAFRSDRRARDTVVIVLAMNSASVMVRSRLFQARRIPPRVPSAGRYT